MARLVSLATPGNTVAAGLGFLLARVVLLGELSPFAVPFLAVIRARRPRAVAGAAVGAALGMVTIREPLGWLEGLLCLLLVLGLLSLPGWRVPRTAWWTAAVAGTVLVAYLATGAAGLLLSGVTPYGLARVALGAGLAALFTLVVMDAMPFLLPPRADAGEGRLSALVLLVLAVEGLRSWGVAFFRAQRVAGAAAVMAAGLVGGAPGGAAAGVLVGMIDMLCGTRPDAAAAALPGVAGLLAGALSPAGRLGAGLGYLLGTTLLGPLAPDPTGVLMALAQAVAGFVIFLIIPRRALEWAGRLLGSPASSPRVETRAPVNASVEVSEALAELSASAARILSVPHGKTAESAGAVFAAIAARLCETCPSRAGCWGKDFCRTHQAFFELLARAEEKGELADEDLPAVLRRRCSRPGELARTLGLVLELKRQEDYWRRRSAESGDLISAMLEGMAEVTAAAAGRPGADEGHGLEMEERLVHVLEQAGFPAVQVRAAPRSPEVRVVAARCPGFDRCRAAAVPAAGAVLGRQVIARRECEWAGDGLRCRFVLSPAPKLGFRVGVARLPKEAGEVAGDSFTACQLDSGRLLLGLSNGMGAGARAAGESQAALKFLEQILRAGFTTATAVRVLNSFMLCRNQDESFATLDLAVVDLHSGEADLVKVGACPSLLRRPHGEVSQVAGGALPLGILRRVDPQRARGSIRDGDILVMVTDGVADPGRRGRRPDWIARLLERPPAMEPQALAQHILEAGRSLGGAADDMTVMVAGFYGRSEGEGKAGGGAET